MEEIINYLRDELYYNTLITKYDNKEITPVELAKLILMDQEKGLNINRSYFNIKKD